MNNNELTIEQIKNIELNILKNVHQFCERNNINYILIGGTLLGAIRHKGFIPWDDDIDIAMPRPDYESFVEKYEHEKYIAQALEKSDNFIFTFCKVIDTTTVLVENKSYQSEIGVNIDVFPLDGLPKDEQLAKRHAKKSLFFKKLITLKQISFRKGRSMGKNIFLLLSKLLLLPFSYRFLTKIAINHAKKYPFDESNFIANLSWGFGIDEIMNRQSVIKRKLTPFEDTEFFISDNYEEFLINRFGDYMTLPPEEKRKSHHGFKAYKLM